jgi:hypothetical protein
MGGREDLPAKDKLRPFLGPQGFDDILSVRTPRRLRLYGSHGMARQGLAGRRKGKMDRLEVNLA